MGIQGLLPLLKDVQTPTNVSQYKGQTLGIDGYVWLHRGAYGCAEKLVLGEATTQYTNYAMHRIRMLRHHGITPYVVFDGDRLPSKAGTEEEREARRSENLARAKSLIRDGRKGSAFEAFAKCIDITPEMAYQLIKCLKAEGVPYVVAPYEADAQLAYLEKTGMIDAVVTEDSDLLVFGCRKVLFKMDSNGDCIEILSSRFTACKTLSFAGWTTDLFRQMAILSGCDYLPSITGMGLKNAHKLLQRYKTVNKVLQAVRLEGKMKIPPDYQAKFEQAEKTFLYQRVWCPRSETLTTLNALEADETAMDYVGPEIARDVARGIAHGEIDPISRSAMVDIAKGFQPGARRSAAAVASSSRAAFRRNTSRDSLPPALPQGQTTLLNFGKRPAGSKTSKAVSLPTMQTPRQPLGIRDVNTLTSNVGTSTTVKSPFFGGKRKAATPPAQEVISPDPVERTPDTDSDSAMLTQHPNASQSPISGIGDYFCELDGADPRLLMSEDEGDKIPAFAALISEKTAEKVRPGGGAAEEEEGEGFEWAVRDCASEVSSEDAHATPKKRSGWQETSSGSSAFSSPSTEVGEASVSPVKRLKRDGSGGQTSGHQEGLILREMSPASPKEDIISSPVQDKETPPIASTARFAEPALPLQKERTGRKRSLSAEDVDFADEEREEEDEEEEDGTGSAQAEASPSLWARYRHQPLRTAQGDNATPVRPRTVLRTPSNRPLRLYAYQSPAENTPFAAPVTASTSKARTPVPVGKRSLSFQSRNDDAENVPSPQLLPTSAIKRMKVDSPAVAQPKLTTSRSLSVLPLSARSSNSGAEDGQIRQQSPLSAFRYVGSPSETKKSLSLGAAPLSLQKEEAGRQRAGTLPSGEEGIVGEKSKRQKQQQQQRGVLQFGGAGQQRQTGDAVPSLGRPSLDRFKFRST
ncbi:hypothetical protein BCV69DRAFT_297157 [Microstroma glucosiphilum]|uniref:Uncharacterized protein n=1 Tax=Pseudomicrostroma glucosiphilum TaxID=1684307 RepID=A0A316UDB6_9BASI|nr:hypothetical protein BCV69DRAFT_297157 [Pseudomicrostroma glucosiphilum]PWN23210.1 hypothetical protein BCV69DRAFT_297157 [Pseudomicrostroma glucosiphilum]